MDGIGDEDVGDAVASLLTHRPTGLVDRHRSHCEPDRGGTSRCRVLAGDLPLRCYAGWWCAVVSRGVGSKPLADASDQVTD